MIQLSPSSEQENFAKSVHLDIEFVQDATDVIGLFFKQEGREQSARKVVEATGKVATTGVPALYQSIEDGATA